MQGQVVKASRGWYTAAGQRCRRPRGRFSCGTARVLPEERAGLCSAERSECSALWK